MIVLKNHKKYIGRGIAVWDEENHIARKYKCVGVTMKFREDGKMLPISLDLKVKSNLTLTYQIFNCFATKRQCRNEYLQSAIINQRNKVLKCEDKLEQARQIVKEIEVAKEHEENILKNLKRTAVAKEQEEDIKKNR